MYYRKEKITGPSYKYPRFSEFIDFLLDREIRYDDEHWAPFFKECTPCHIHYNFIGHFETLYWDIHLLANKTNLVDKWDDQTVKIVNPSDTSHLFIFIYLGLFSIINI